MGDTGVAGEETSRRRICVNLADLSGVEGRAGKGAAAVVVIEFGEERLPAQTEINYQAAEGMIGVLHVEPDQVLAKIVELLAALIEGTHLAREEIEQRIVAVLAGEG